MIDFFYGCQPLAGMAMGKFSFKSNDLINYGAEVIETSTSSLVSVMGVNDAERHDASIQSIQGIRALNDEKYLLDDVYYDEGIRFRQDYKQKDKASFINHALQIIKIGDCYNSLLHCLIYITEPDKYKYIPCNREEEPQCRENIEYMIHLLALDDSPLCDYNYAPVYLKNSIYSKKDIQSGKIQNDLCGSVIRNRILDGLTRIKKAYIGRITIYMMQFKFSEQDYEDKLYNKIDDFKKFIWYSIDDIKDNLLRYSASLGNTYHLYNWIIYRFITIAAKSYNFVYCSGIFEKLNRPFDFPIIDTKHLMCIIPRILVDPIQIIHPCIPTNIISYSENLEEIHEILQIH